MACNTLSRKKPDYAQILAIKIGEFDFELSKRRYFCLTSIVSINIILEDENFSQNK